MKHLFLLLGAFLPFLLVGQPIVDGNLSDALYTTLASASSGDDFGFGNELGVIKYYADGSDIYLGISGKLNDNNNIVLFFNFSGYNGRPAGTQLDPQGNTEGSAGVFGNDGLDEARMDLEVDFALAFNEGYTSSTFYMDAARYGTNDILNTQYVGPIGSQTGTSGTLPIGTIFGGAATNMTLAYRNDYTTGSNLGIEMKIPIATFAGVTNVQDLQLFAVITGQNGFISNESIPGDIGPNGGFDPDLSAIAGLDLFTGFFALPVTFSHIQVTKAPQGHQVTWATATEQNNEWFEVQRSSDSKTWRPLGRLAGAGTTSSAQTYQFTDQEPARGINYYRIRQIDFDGTTSFSNIVAAHWDGKGNIQIFPNPSSEQIVLTGLADRQEVVTITISDAAGRTRYRQTYTGEPIDVSQLGTGVYWLQIATDKGILDQQQLFLH